MTYAVYINRKNRYETGQRRGGGGGKRDVGRIVRAI